MPGIAARSAAFGKRWLPGQLGGTPGPSVSIGTGPVAGPTDPIGLAVELFLGSAWVDISPYVYYQSKIRIVRGKPNETSQIQPQTCTFVINNRDGRFSPRNPTGPYYQQIGRNTPIRVSRMQNGIRRFRFHGEVPSWPTTWDITGTDVRVTITAAGQMRRLFQGNQPLHSSLYRAYGLGLGLGSGIGAGKPIAYWPCEDGANSTVIASGLAGGTAMSLSGQAPPTFASNSSFPGSLSLPLLAGSIWTGTIPTYTNPGTDPTQVGASAAVGFCLSIPATGAYDGGVLARMTTTGTVARFDLVYGAVSGGSVALIGYDSSGTQLFTSGYQSPQSFSGYGMPGYNGMPVFINFGLTPSGTPGSIIYEGNFQPLYPHALLSQSFGIFAATISGTVGNATSVVINPDGHFNDTAVGHIVFQGYTNFGLAGFVMSAWLFEPPATPFYYPTTFAWSPGRFLRLCQEQGVQGAVILAAGTNAGDPTTMGYQANATFANLIQEPATTSGGLLFEARNQNSLILRERGTLYNQVAKLTLDHSQHQLSGPLNPVDDDALTRNDITVSRIGGSSAQLQLTTGTLSVQPPPAGVGDYPTSYSLSLGSDSQLSDQAGWRLHLGTVDQPRFPNVPINLRHPTFTSNVDMMNAALTIDIGDRLVITNPPPWMPPDPISQIVQGYTEILGIWEHDIVFNCSPEDPYKVGLLDDTVLGRLDTDGSTLTLPTGTTDPTITVTTTGSATGSALWTTTPGDFPFDIAVGGERMTVTNIVGVAMTSFGGADGTFESGTANWTPDANSTIVQSSAQAHQGTYSGLLTTVSGSAVNGTITSPHFTVIAGNRYTASGWFQKNSGTSGGANVQILWYDGSNTFLTSDQAGVAYTSGWQNATFTVTAPSNAASAAMVVYGGAASGTNSFYIDDLSLLPAIGPQLFTVTRSVNGIVKAQTAGTDVRLWQPMYLSI